MTASDFKAYSIVAKQFDDIIVPFSNVSQLQFCQGSPLSVKFKLLHSDGTFEVAGKTLPFWPGFTVPNNNTSNTI